jgi:hypothetical protein
MLRVPPVVSLGRPGDWLEHLVVLVLVPVVIAVAHRRPGPSSSARPGLVGAGDWHWRPFLVMPGGSDARAGQ